MPLPQPPLAVQMLQTQRTEADVNTSVLAENGEEIGADVRAGDEDAGDNDTGDSVAGDGGADVCKAGAGAVASTGDGAAAANATLFTGASAASTRLPAPIWPPLSPMTAAVVL